MNIKINLFDNKNRKYINTLRDKKSDILTNTSNHFDKDIINNFIINDFSSDKSPQK